MAVYSANRIQSMRSSTVVADESYVGTAGAMRALVESVMNDQAIFEAALSADFKQVHGLSEGTLLESEIEALDEASAKSFLATVKEGLKRFWEKIKGVFKTVYAKLTQWIVRNGKAYVAMHRKTIDNKSLTGFELKGYREFKGNVIQGADKALNSFDLKNTDGYDAAKPFDFVNKKLGDAVSETGVTSENFKDKMIDHCYKDSGTFSGSAAQGIIKKAMDNVSTGSSAIKELKKAKATVDKGVRNAIKEVEKADFDKSDKEKKDAHKNTVEVARTYASTYQRVVSIWTAGAVNAVRFGIKQDRAAIAKAVAYTPGTPKGENAIMFEAAVLEAENDLEELENDSVPEDSIPEEFPADIDAVDVPAEDAPKADD